MTYTLWLPLTVAFAYTSLTLRTPAAPGFVCIHLMHGVDTTTDGLTINTVDKYLNVVLHHSHR